MKFAYYNPSDESRSCVVRTLTKLTGKAYQTVKDELTALASETGYPEYNEPAVFERYLAEHGFLRCMDDCGIAVRELRLEKGAYCVFCTNGEEFCHLLPVVDGVIYDRRDDCRGLLVLAVYRKTGESA